MLHFSPNDLDPEVLLETSRSLDPEVLLETSRSPP